MDAADVVLDWRTAFNPDTPNSCAAFVGNGKSDVVTCTVIVTVNYDFNAATPIIGNIVGTIAMSGESKMSVEFACPRPPQYVDADCPVGGN